MTAPNICPATHRDCDTAEVCWLMWCGRLPKGAARPLSERQLTQAERYARHMAKQRNVLLGSRG